MADTPKDNVVLERFNRTIQEEFVETTTITPDETKTFNQELVNWLEEYCCLSITNKL